MDKSYRYQPGKDYSSHKRTISSSSGKDMLVQFFTDDDQTARGFSASFNYVPIDPDCANWLNLTEQLFKSPDYPTVYYCSWVITGSSINNRISINFETLEVNYI